ncbi:MAG: hypothetical protein L7S64_11975 [Longimicrobiales bacterium]|nr:hypothetical protein [Longimicrobiales bacterium]
MLAYIIRRLLLIPVTLTGIFLTSFLIINFSPGGPLEALIAEMQGISTDLGDRMIGAAGDVGEAPKKAARSRSAATSTRSRATAGARAWTP